MDWSAVELRQLRCRMGWSQAEMARCLKLDLATVVAWELGPTAPSTAAVSQLAMIFNQCESIADRVQRRPIGEVMMKSNGLSQIHDLEIIENVADQISIEKTVTLSVRTRIAN